MHKNHTSTLRRVLAVLLSVVMALAMALPAFATDDQSDHTHRFTEQPEYVWAEDFSTCDAVFTCAECGEPVSYPAAVTKEWKTGPDAYGRGTYYYIATLTVDGNPYAGFTVVYEAEGDVPANLCKWCEQDHSGSVWQKIVGFFHSILYFFAHLFGQR